MIYVGTFSKSLFPSLRLGYFLAPPMLVDTMSSIMSKVMHGVPTFLQAVVAEFIDEGHFASHLRRMRKIYAERHDVLCAVGAAHDSPDCSTWCRAQSGLHTIAHLRRGLAETAVTEAARERNVTVSPIGRFSLTKAPSRGLVLGFGGVPPKDIEAGVEVLAEVLESQARR